MHPATQKKKKKDFLTHIITCLSMFSALYLWQRPRESSLKAALSDLVICIDVSSGFLVRFPACSTSAPRTLTCDQVGSSYLVPHPPDSTAYCVGLILCRWRVGQMHFYAVPLEDSDGMLMTLNPVASSIWIFLPRPPSTSALVFYLTPQSSWSLR